jgi:predicted XRE-type DNA-binding protein
LTSFELAHQSDCHHDLYEHMLIFRANGKVAKRMTAKIEVHEGSDNIFADLGLPAADSHFLKAQIVAELYRLTNGRKLTQSKAGEIMGISQPEVSRLFKGNFREYSIERLMAFLTAFDRDVEIVSRPRPKRAKKSGRGQIIFKPVAA